MQVFRVVDRATDLAIQVPGLRDGCVCGWPGVGDELRQWADQLVVIRGNEHDNAEALFARFSYPVSGCREESIGPAFQHVIERGPIEQAPGSDDSADRGRIAACDNLVAKGG